MATEVIEMDIPAEDDAAQVVETATEIILSGSGETASIWEVDTKTGEIIRDECAPEETASAEQAAAYIGPRLVAARAEHAALVAEKEVWQKTIDERYDARIKAAKRRVTWLENGAGFRDTLRAFTQKALANAKVRNLPLSFLILSLKKKPALVQISDPAQALAYCKAVHPEAVKVEEKVLISLVPKDVRAAWRDGKPIPANAGFERVPEDEEFSIK